MGERADRIQRAYAALDQGDVSAFRDLFRPDAQWLGVPGSGIDRATPI